MPSLQLNVKLGADVTAGAIRTLRVTVSAAGRTKTSELDPAQLKRNGTASVVVLVGSAGSAGFDADVLVLALDADAMAVARARETFSGSGDGCNTFTMTLAASTPTGDAGVSDTQPRDSDAPGDQRLDLPAGTDVVLADFLEGLSASLRRDRPIVVVVPSGTTVGASGITPTPGTPARPAISSGDLSSYSGVTLEISGEVQGAGGVANSGAGGDAITLTSPLRLHITPTGRVRGGGGGGGRGGPGGSGNIAGTWTAWQYSDVTPKSFWSPTWDEIRWNDVGGIATGQMCCLYAFDDGLVYQKGTQRTFSPLPILYEVRRASLIGGRSGNGGDGGRGRGYGAAETDGSAGGAGTNRAGTGGKGGRGGSWGAAGEVGQGGGIGYHYGASSESDFSPGLPGLAGGAAGKAVSAPGLTIPFRNEGEVDGALDFTRATF